MEAACFKRVLVGQLSMNRRDITGKKSRQYCSNPSYTMHFNIQISRRCSLWTGVMYADTDKNKDCKAEDEHTIKKLLIGNYL
jgi:hypothetical protein